MCVEVRGQLLGLGSFPSTMQVLDTIYGDPQVSDLMAGALTHRSYGPSLFLRCLFRMICRTAFGQIHS